MDGALAALWRGREASVAVDKDSYGFILAACCGTDVEAIDDGLAAEAVRIFKDAEIAGVPPNESMMTSYLRACCHVDDIDEAKRMAATWMTSTRRSAWWPPWGRRA
mmetsp:Transcript_32936/g.104286  ORF Transcript_32936/g.104286 Transcript_32936/m.104286 type:complete len:106 (-) Transcript_32936:1330-1647(-)